ncbi:MAG: LicD family protein, partial [Butyrivibrio sp.]|nr:LicD family protein [Butyrivibrio sp.]
MRNCFCAGKEVFSCRPVRRGSKNVIKPEEIRHRCLAIAKDIDRVCTKYGIRYSLCGGSVIGAHLYRGFIPWDDDIDLMMTRE